MLPSFSMYWPDLVVFAGVSRMAVPLGVMAIAGKLIVLFEPM